MSYDYGYPSALKAAGAEVLAFKQFGSYQGDWYARVRFDGADFWLHDYYGSCSGCDAFEADVGFHHDEEIQSYIDEDHPKYAQMLADFGKRYLEPQERLTLDQAIELASKDLDWDSDAQEVVDWLKAQGTPTRSAETTGSVGEADGGPVAEPCAPTQPES